MKINNLALVSMVFLLSACSEQASDNTESSTLSKPVTAVEVPHSTATKQSDEDDLYANMRGTAEGGEGHPGSAL